MTALIPKIWQYALPMYARFTLSYSQHKHKHKKMEKGPFLVLMLMLMLMLILLLMEGEEQGSKSPLSLLSEPISPSSLLFISSSRSIQFNSPYSQLCFFSLLPTFSPYFSLLPTFFWAISPSSLAYSVPPLLMLLRFSHISFMLMFMLLLMLMSKCM